LTVLIFLSSGVFTLLSDVKSNYTSQFEDYKKISKIHDLTVDTEIAATGDKPGQSYIADGITPEKTEYISANSVVNTKNAIRVFSGDIKYENDDSTTEGYVQVSKLEVSGSTADTNYVKLKDLYRFLQSNNIANFVNATTGVVEARNFPPTPLKKYLNPNQEIDANYRLNTTDKITIFKSGNSNITFGDLVLVVPGTDG
jgi:hypothetical protein